MPDYYQTTYPRSDCQIGVVHIGFGAFHRAHQAVYFDDYMELSGDLNWGIAAINLSPRDSDDFQNIAQSITGNGGYMLKTTDPKGVEDYRLVRAHLEFYDWASEKEAAESILAHRAAEIVTITVTESGYYLDTQGRLNTADPTIATEIKTGVPTTVYGFLMNALMQRPKDRPLTILCCDNISSNGLMFKRNFAAYLDAVGNDEIKEWVAENISFPCSMVDRITPRTSSQTDADIAQKFPQYADHPINAEAFMQWVIEDNFKGERPDLNLAGAEFATDVSAYEQVKIRILNGGHTSLAYLGILSGYETFDQAMHDAELKKFFDDWQNNEVLPGITKSLPIDKNDYKNIIANRFSNTAITDSLERICMDGFAKFSIFIKPTIESCLQQNIAPEKGYSIIASWYIYARRIASGQIGANYIEPNWPILAPMLEKGSEEQFATSALLWGDLPVHYPQFKEAIINAIRETDLKWLA